MNTALIDYYEAIEHASQDMLEAARSGDWDHFAKLEGACALLVSQLGQAAGARSLEPAEVRAKSRILQRILLNDAEVRRLAEPWLAKLDRMLGGGAKTLH